MIVQGQYSLDMILDNRLFQGIGLDPSLQNSFFSDVSVPVKSPGGRESMFADDLNVFQEFDRRKNLAEVQDTLQQCRDKVHKWGEANRVSFNPSQKHLVVLHPSDYHGPSFQLLSDFRH